MKSVANSKDLLTNVIYDTWDIRDDVAIWYISSPANLKQMSNEEINNWYVDTTKKILNSSSNFARAWKFYFRADPEQSDVSIEIEWESETLYEQYCNKVINLVENFPYAISRLLIEVDLCVFVKTSDSSEIVKGWIRNLGKFEISQTQLSSEPYVYLDIRATLFCCMYDNHKKLYLLNKPLLENTLHNLEQAIGKIDEVEGIEGIYEYGFFTKD